LQLLGRKRLPSEEGNSLSPSKFLGAWNFFD